MSKIQIKNTKNSKLICNKLKYPEGINERIYKEIETRVYDCFLPINIQSKGKETRLIVDVSLILSISQFLNGCISKKLFLNITSKIIKIIKKCEANHINVNNIDWNMDRIFYIPQSCEVKCIYWPIVNNQCETSPYLFLKEFPSKVKFIANEDLSFLVEYKNFFCEGNPFSINNFEKMIAKLQGNEVQISEGIPVSTEQEYVGYNDVEEKSDIAYDPFKNDRDVLVPILIRKSNSEYAQIGNSNFSIGSDSECNFAVRDNRFVSKVHAIISCVNGRFFITDQNSTNKTYVDGVQLVTGATKEIFDNTEIRIANEMFVFKFM